MPRLKYQTLTEQMFYILLCLEEECSGIDLFERIRRQTGGRVTVGSGTLYNLLEQFLNADMICEVRSEGRKRSYCLTVSGRQALSRECKRLKAQLADYNAVFGKEEPV